MTDEEYEKLKKWGEDKQKELDDWLLIWGEEYKKMPEEKLRERLEMQDDETLRWMVNDIALPVEHYELCKMAKNILAERGQSL